MYSHNRTSVWNQTSCHQLLIYRGNLQDLGVCDRENLKEPSPTHVHSLHTSHQLSSDQFNIIGREDQDLSRLIKESIYIRVNNPTLNRNICKCSFVPLTLIQPFSKGMCAYVHKYYISCSYVRLYSDLKKCTVVNKSLSVFKPMFCYENTFSYFMEKARECRNLHKVNAEADYFAAGPNTEPDMAASAKTTIKLHNESSKVFTGIGCFKGTFSLKVKEDTKPIQAPPRSVEYALQELF